MWTPTFACPECGALLVESGPRARQCEPCGRGYEHREGIWRLLTATRADRIEPFARQYRAVREVDGHRRAGPAEYYRALPSVASTHPHAVEWSIRRETYHHLLKHVLASAPQPSRVLDVGAGTGWLCHRLDALGQLAVAVDVLDDEVDGLGASRHYVMPFTAVQADFDALPFAPHQFDLVIFNGSLHYAPDAAATLARARRMLDTGGALVVMDSPMFQRDGDGTAMVADKCRRFTSDLGIDAPIRPGVGYLTFARLGAIAQSLKLEPRFVPSRGPLTWRRRRHVARVRLRRAPAAFGVWMAHDCLL